MADLDLINDCDVDVAALYAASKAALNVIVAKFNAQYKKDGVLFMSISPGLVEVERNANGTSSPPPSSLQHPGILLMHPQPFRRRCTA